MLINCETCTARDLACSDCVVNILLSAPPAVVDLHEDEWAALEVLAAGGLLPRVLEVDRPPRTAGEVSRVPPPARERRAG